MKLKITLALSLSALLFPGLVLGEDPNWQGKMKSLGEAVGELLPELVSRQGDPKIIEKGAKTLSELSHDLKVGRKSGKLMPPSDSDPSVTFLAEQFSDQTRRAYSAIKQGQLEYGKSLLRGVTSYCIACHTRHENGPEFSSFPLSAKANTLGKEEKAALFVATRQFDKGLALYQEILKDEEMMKARPFDWDRVLRQSLAISVRVKKDPEIAAKSVQTALDSPFLPEFQRTKLSKWKRSIDAWKKEPKVKTNSEAGYSAEMKRLLRQAAQMQLYPIDQSAEIQYLRASAAAHDVLCVGRDPKIIAEALMSAGAAYEVLANPAFWPMHEFYYQACIRELPHTSLALDCYLKFEQSVFFGYTGSSGTHIPGDTQELLIELKTLATPNKKARAGK